MRDNISSDNLIKVCPKCGEEYAEESNFCSKHSDLVKLVYAKDLVKICPKCGKKYTENNNFCSKHRDAVKLVYIKDLVKKCRACGALYPEEYNYCIRCEWDEPLEKIYKNTFKIIDIQFNPNTYYNFSSHKNNFNELDELLSNKNIDELEKFDFTQNQFDSIIENIIKTHEMLLNDLIEKYYIDFNNLNILDKMILFSKAFVKTYYKEGGGDLGHFEFNEIHIDDRLETPLQITTIIHELSHFLFSEILEQTISEILNTDKSDALEAFVSYVLVKDDLNYLIDEYCAHTVEGRFAVLGYQDYGSYKETLKRVLDEYSKAHVDVANTIGNTFAIYIKRIMSSFIDDELREEIKNEFSDLRDEKRYGELKYETADYLKWDKFKDAMRIILTKNIEIYVSNPDNIKELFAYSTKFKENNGSD